MNITTPMTAAMEMYNWLNDKILRGDRSEYQPRMSPLLEKYFSAAEARKQQEILSYTLRDLAETVTGLEKKANEGLKSLKIKEDRKSEITQLYVR